MVLDVSLGQTVESLLHAVGEYADYAQHLGSGLTQYVDYLYTAAGRRDKILDNDYLLALLEATLDLVGATMILRSAAYVSHGQVEYRGGDGGMGYACGARTHQHLTLRIVALYQLGKPLLDGIAYARRRERQTVVAIYGAFDTAGPRERLLGTQKYGPYREQVFGNGLFHKISIRFVYQYSFRFVRCIPVTE